MKLYVRGNRNKAFLEMLCEEAGTEVPQILSKGYRSCKPSVKRGIKSISHLYKVLPRNSHSLQKYISLFLICNQISR